MGAAFVPVTALIGAGFLMVLGACSARQPATPIGMSDAEPESAPEANEEAPSMPWPDFAAARAWPEAAPPSVALAHRRDGTLVHVRVEPSALDAYRQLSTETAMPEGARIVAWHETPAGALLGGYLLEKRSGEWAALEIDARGALIPGEHTRCVRCHDMAPTDHLFGTRSAPRASSSATRESQPSDRR